MVSRPYEVARVPIATPAGEYDVRALQCSSGFVYLALVKGDLGDGKSVLTRLHSECLTGDALGSLRCDCGLQLRMALRAITAEGRGVLLYATGQEGRGIGLVNKLRAYMLQDLGADTLDANLNLGLPVDSRDYGDAAAALSLLGVRSVRLLTNNPAKERGLRAGGMKVNSIVPIPISPHLRNMGYLRTKQHRLGHIAPGGAALPDTVDEVPDACALLGEPRPPAWRPYVVLKYAQTLDGRIATATGDSKWISGEDERRVSHALRASCDAVLVGVGTVIADDPQLTVRMVPGASPLRVVLDSRLRLPMTAKVLDESAGSIVLTTERASARRRLALRAWKVGLREVSAGPGGVDPHAALQALREMGIGSVLVEGGARVITSMLGGGLVDRLIISLAPTIIGAGMDAVGDLRVSRIAEGLRLVNRSVHSIGEDLVVAGDVEGPATSGATAATRT